MTGAFENHLSKENGMEGQEKAQACFISVWALLFCTQVCLTLCDLTDCSPPLPRLLCPWDLPGKKSGVHCHFLL